MSALGSCLCGAITYQVSGPLRPVIACHCTQCRKTSGHHVAATAAAPDDVIITGEPQWYRSSDQAERGFCPVCGSNLFWRRPDHLSIFAGTLDEHPELHMAAHIFCDDKGRYYDITDGLPRAGGWDPALSVQAEDLAKDRAKDGGAG